MGKRYLYNHLVLLSLASIALSACTKDQDFGKVVDEASASKSTLSASSQGSNSSSGGSSSSSSGGTSSSSSGGTSSSSSGGTSSSSGGAFLNGTDTFSISQTSTNKLDILFVVDNSPSMGGNQGALATSFSNFISQFGTNIDYQIGVISTSLDGSGYSNVPGAGSTFADRFIFSSSNLAMNYFNPVMNELLFRNNGNDKIIKSTSTVDPVRQFAGRCTKIVSDSGADRAHFAIDTLCTPSNGNISGLGNIQIGSWGSSYEQPLNSVIGFMSGSDHTQLFRSNSLSAIIFVSDENEVIKDSDLTDAINSTQYSSTNNGTTVTNNCNQAAIQNRINRFTAATAGLNLKMKFIYETTTAATSYNYCANPGGVITMHYPEVLKKLATDTNSTVANINVSDFSSTLTQIGSELNLDTISTKVLSHTGVIESSIVVKVNGVTIPNSNTNGWSYNSATNSIKVNGSYIVVGANVEITYQYQ